MSQSNSENKHKPSDFDTFVMVDMDHEQEVIAFDFPTPEEMAAASTPAQTQTQTPVLQTLQPLMTCKKYFQLLLGVNALLTGAIIGHEVYKKEPDFPIQVVATFNLVASILGIISIALHQEKKEKIDEEMPLRAKR